MNVKKRYLTALAAVVVIVLVAFILIQVQSRTEYDRSAVSVEFHTDTLELVFSAKDGYEFEWLRSSDEYLNLPEAENVHSVAVDSSSVPVGKNAFFKFAVQSVKGSEGDYYDCELLHQSDSQFIVEVLRKSDGKLTSFTFDY